MNTDTRQKIKTALQAFSGSDLRDASIGLLNTLGYPNINRIKNFIIDYIIRCFFFLFPLV